MNRTNKQLKIVVLTTKLPEDIWLVNRLADICHIDGIVLPSGKRYPEYGIAYVLKNRVRQVGLFTVTNQALLVLYRLLFERRRDKRALKELFTVKPTDHIEKKDIDVLEVKDINSDEVKNFILSKAPQLVVVSGAPILKKKIIDAFGGKIINLHPGFAPQYRGRYGSFWPIYNMEPELVGVTVHFVDTGIDTGAILIQQQVDYYPDDTLKMVTYKQHKLGVDLLVKCLQQFESFGANAYHKTDCPSNNYLAPGLTQYLEGRRWIKRRSKGRKSAPSFLKQKEPAIVLSTHTMGLGVIRSLGIVDIPIVAVHYDSGDMGYLSKYVKERIHAPHPEKYEDQFINLLLESAKRFSGGLLIPTCDDTLTTVSKHKDLLEQYYTVACTEWEITKRYIEKIQTYALAESAGLPVPKTIVPRSVYDLKECARMIQYPCLVKPSQSHQYFNIFNTKMVQVKNFNQLVDAYEQAVAAGIEVMVQEYIPGDDSQVVNYNSYFWNGEPLVEFTAQQIRKAPPEFGAPRVVMSKDIPDVIEPGRNVLRAINFYGYSCTEFKMDPRDNTYKLMEVNGRHNRSTLLAVSCGINFPELQYKHLVQGELPSPSPHQNGLYWISLERDVGYGIKYVFKERYSFIQYLRPYLRRHVFDILNWRDIKPFLGRCFYLVKRTIQRILTGREGDLYHLETGG